MANIKSAKKRIITNNKSRMTNKVHKSTMRTAIKQVETSVEAGNKEEAVVALNAATKRIDSAVSKGVMHKNAAARTKSRLAKKVNNI